MKIGVLRVTSYHPKKEKGKKMKITDLLNGEGISLN